MNMCVNTKTLFPLFIFETVQNYLHCSKVNRRGAPCRFKAEWLFQTLIFRLKTALPLRIISALFAIPLTTLFRHCRRLSHRFAELHERENLTNEADPLIVDTTSTRVRSTDLRFYSGYKKQRVVKVQAICCAKGLVRHVSSNYAGSVHDKTIWENELVHLPSHHTILADRAYAGSTGDGSHLKRPIRKNEVLFKLASEKAREQNRQLSLKRVKIEHLFARLKTWRIIHHYFPQKPETYSTIFKAIAFIHDRIVMKKISEL